MIIHEVEQNTLTQKQLKELLNYCPNTGIFTWIISPSKRFKAGDIARSSRKGYIDIRIICR